jgi:hypothetical protein
MAGADTPAVPEGTLSIVPVFWMRLYRPPSGRNRKAQEASMRNIAKFATAAAIVGAMALATTPSQAEHGRNAAAAIGFGAGALVGAAAANAAANNAYYGPDYGPAYYGGGYAYEPGYAYDAEPTYEPAYAPVAPRQCWVSTDSSRGFGYYGSCASTNKDTDSGYIGEARRNVTPLRP